MLVSVSSVSSPSKTWQVRLAKKGGTFHKPSQLYWTMTTELLEQDFRIAHSDWCLGWDVLDQHHTGPWCLRSNKLVALFFFHLFVLFDFFVHIVASHPNAIARKLWVYFVGSHLLPQHPLTFQRHASKQWLKNDVKRMISACIPVWTDLHLAAAPVWPHFFLHLSIHLNVLDTSTSSVPFGNSYTMVEDSINLLILLCRCDNFAKFEIYKFTF